MSGNGAHPSGMARVVSSLLLLSSVAGIATAADKPKAKDDPVVILVATFDGPGDEGGRLADQLVARIKGELKDHPKVEVRRLAEVITEAQGSAAARAKGNAHLANYVVWGRCATKAGPVEIAHLEWTGGGTESKSIPSQKGFELLLDLHVDVRLLSFQLHARPKPVNDALVNLVIASVLCKPDQRRTALAKLDTLPRLIPAGGIPQPASLHKYRGELLLGLGKLDQALAEYDQAVHHLPDCPDLYVDRGLLRDERKDYEKAIADYDSSEKLGFNKKCLLICRGIVYQHKGELEHAIAELDQAVKLDETSAWARAARSSVRSQQGLFDRAISDMNEAIRLDPKRAAFYLARGIFLSRMQQVDRALADYSEAIRRDEDWAQPYFFRGDTYLNLDNLEGALADFDKGLHLEPESAMAF